MTDVVIASSVLFCFLPVTKQTKSLCLPQSANRQGVKTCLDGKHGSCSTLKVVLFKPRDVITIITKCNVLIYHNHV